MSCAGLTRSLEVRKADRYLGSEGNRVPAKSQLHLEIILVAKQIITTLFYQNIPQTQITNFITVTK